MAKDTEATQPTAPSSDSADSSRHWDMIELVGSWAVQAPYILAAGELDLEIEHLQDGMAVTAPVGWRVHVPTHSGTRYVHIPEGWTSTVPLATQCVVMENGSTFVNLTHRQPDFSPTQLEISSAHGRVRLRWQFGEDVPPFRCLPFESWDELIADHRAWMERYAGVRPLTDGAPDWLATCPLAVYLDVQSPTQPDLIHSFDDVVELAGALQAQGAPPDTMVYLTTWNERFERAYPTYEPSREAGGLDGLTAAAEALHERGYRLMLHANVWGCSQTHPDYTRLQAHRIHNRAGHPVNWREFYRNNVVEYACIRPDAGAYREVFWGSLKPVVEATGLDALYLDQAGLIVDDPEHDLLAATQTLLATIQADAPELVLGGQVLHSRLCRDIRLWQLWGTPWSGHGWGQPFRRRSPLIADLFRDYVRFCAHIYLPAAVPGRYLWTHEAFNEDLGTVSAFLTAQEDNSYHGAMPSVRLNYRDHGIDPLSAEVIEQARRKAGAPAPVPSLQPTAKATSGDTDDDLPRDRRPVWEDGEEE